MNKEEKAKLWSDRIQQENLPEYCRTKLKK